MSSENTAIINKVKFKMPESCVECGFSYEDTDEDTDYCMLFPEERRIYSSIYNRAPFCPLVEVV